MEVGRQILRRGNHSIDIMKGIKIFGELNETLKWNTIFSNNKTKYYKTCKGCEKEQINNNHVIYCENILNKITYADMLNDEIGKLSAVQQRIQNWQQVI